VPRAALVKNAPEIVRTAILRVGGNERITRFVDEL
jgi:hypothetical protein